MFTYKLFVVILDGRVASMNCLKPFPNQDIGQNRQDRNKAACGTRHIFRVGHLAQIAKSDVHSHTNRLVRMGSIYGRCVM